MGSPLPKFILPLMGLCSVALGEPADREPTFRVLPDIPYKANAPTPYERDRCLLDLYLPADTNATGFATIVWFHGGALKTGEKDGKISKAVAESFARDGIAVASANYRLSPRATFPAYIEDAAAAVSWVLANIHAHGGDDRRVYVSGHSAGGYLSAMVGMDPQFLKMAGVPGGPSRLAGYFPVAGQMVTHSTVREERGISKTRPLIDAAAPSYHVRPGTPPFLLIVGDNDLPARAAENWYFTEAMRAAKSESVTYLKVGDRNHGTIASEIAQPDDPARKAILSMISTTPQKAAAE